MTAGTPCRIRLPVFFSILLTEGKSLPSRGSGREGVVAVFILSNGTMAASGEKIAADSWVTHPVYDMIGAGPRLFDANNTQLEYTPRQRAEIPNAGSVGHKGNQV